MDRTSAGALPAIGAVTERPLTDDILLALLTQGPMTQRNLAHNTGRKRSAIAAATSALFQAKDITKRRAPEGGTLGRPEVAFEALPDKTRFVGVAVVAHTNGPCVLEAVLTNRSPKTILASASRRLAEKRPTPDQLATSVRAIADELQRLADDSRQRPVALGVAIGGHVDAEGNIVQSPNLRWKGVPLRRLLEKTVGLPSIVINDVNALAMHQASLSVDSHTTFAEVLVGDGVGAAFVLDGAVFLGSTGGAGEIGHGIVEPDGRKCACGLHGCVQTVAGYRAIRAAARKAGLTPHVSDVVNAAERSQRNAQKILQSAAQALAIAVGGMANVLDPRTVFIASTALSQSAYFIGEFERRLAAATFPSLLPRVIWIATDYRAGAAGAAWAAFVSNPRRT